MNFSDEELEVTQNEVPAESGGEGADVSAPAVSVLGDPAAAVGDEYVTLQETPDEHLFYSTDFSDFTVTEGLLLLIFVILLVDFFLNLVRRWF